jgi:hypothetical protein
MTEPGPIELTKIGCDPAAFRKVGANEYKGPCPICGGKDRFVIFTNRPFPHWNYFCRVCTPEGGWIDQLNKQLRDPMTDAQRQAYALQHQEETKRAEAARISRLKEFTTAELWAELNRRMSEENHRWWKQRGIDNDWQNYLQLGYTDDKVYKVGDLLYHSPAYTIPYLRQDKPVTMQYRLTDPQDPADKYRFENGLPAAWYTTEPNQKLADQVIICEGAIKAIVTKMYMTHDLACSVLAVPSKNSWAGIVEHVKDCGRVWVVLDPDGQKLANKLGAEIGRNARVINLPGKIDDMINADELDENSFAYALKTAYAPSKVI